MKTIYDPNPPELIRSGVRGKYAKQFREGSNVVLIDPDLVSAFPNTKAVNDALRQYWQSISGPQLNHSPKRMPQKTQRPLAPTLRAMERHCCGRFCGRAARQGDAGRGAACPELFASIKTTADRTDSAVRENLYRAWT